MIVVTICTLCAIVLCVALHYKVLFILNKSAIDHARPVHVLLPLGVLIIIFIHVIEMWIFGVMYYFLLSLGDVGHIMGDFHISLIDCGYFSFVNYTSLGYGDLVPVGAIRFAAATEALTGLVLIAWTASFTYLQMQKINRKPIKK